MAFDAGAIEATLTLNRNPFTAGLAAARAQARSFAKEKYTATADINVKSSKATAQVIAFRKLLGTLDDQTVKLNANTRAFGDAASGSFDKANSRFEKLAAAAITALPVIASAFTATVGAVGALASGLVIAGAGAGAFALVAVPAFKQIKAAAAEGQAAVNKLPPGLREAGNAMIGLNKEYQKLVTNNQKLTGIALAAWFNAGTAALRSLGPLVAAASEAFANVGERARIFFEGDWWKTFVTFLTANVMPVISRFGVLLFDVITIIGNFTMAIWKAGGQEIFNGILDGISKFAIWTDKLGQNKTFQQFMNAAVRSLPIVGALLGELIEFIIKLAIGLEPLGSLIIQIFTGIFNTLNSMPIPVIQGIAFAIAAVWASIALGATGPVGIAIGVLAGLAAIFVNLAQTNDGLRASFQATVDHLKAIWLPIWDTIVKNFNEKILPAWNELVRITRDELIPKLQRFGEVIEKEVWPKIQPLVDEITGTLIPALLGFLGALERIIGFLVDVFGPTVAEEMGSAITVFQGAFDIIAGALDIFTATFSGDWTKFHQGLEEVNRGFWTIIAGMFGTNLDGLRTTVQQWDRDIDTMWREFWGSIVGFFQGFWQTIKDMWHGALAILRGDTEQGATLIGRAWGRVANFFREPINWVINTVINDGIIGAWNTVMGWIGVGGISGRVPGIPAFSDAFAMGGPVQGGIPGKDSVPILAQQGEYVLSVPAVQAMGGIDAVDRMHTAARGGPTGTRSTVTSGLPGYANGGPVGGLSMWSLLGSQVSNLFHGLSFGHAPGGGMIGDAISRIPGALINKVLEAVQKKLESIVVAIFGGGTGSVVANGALQQMIAATAAQFGWGGPQIAAINWIISHESGGNPNAQNPTSTAYGLFQFLNSTWGSVGGTKTSDPAAQILYGLRYIASRYGSPTGAQAFWQSHGWYDNGGWLPPGTTMATNMTGSPEAILTLPQLNSLASRGVSRDEIAAIVHEIVGSLGGGGGDTYNVMLPEKATVRELADTLDFKRRVVSKGRYSR